MIVDLPIDTLRIARPLRPLARTYVQKQAQLNALPPREASRVVYGGMISNVSAVVLLLVPGFALLLKLLYRSRLYIERIIFILHLHSALFLVALLPLLIRDAWLFIAYILWALAYILLAMRRVYTGSLPGTLVRYTVVLLMYNIAAVGVILAVIVTTVLMY